MIQLKYYYEFRSLKNKLWRVEIYENSETAITPVDVKKSFNGCTLEFKEQESKFDTVIGSGVKFDLFAKSTFQFIDLYTGDIKKYQVRVYVDSVALWVGWLNTEYYNEDWSRSKNIQIDLTATDLSILERLKYLDGDGNPYTGISTLFEILTRCLAKLELPFRYLYISCSTLSATKAAAVGETTLHIESNKNRNYYDEDYKALDCLKVVEGVLKTFQLSIKQVGTDLIVYDVEAVAKNATFKKYDAKTLSFIGEENLNTCLGGIEQIGYQDTDSTFSIVPSYNREKLTYSTFKQAELANIKISPETVSELTSSRVITDVRDGKDYSYRLDQYKKTEGLISKTFVLDVSGYAAILTPVGDFVKNEEPISGILISKYSAQGETDFIKLTANLPVLINDSDSYALKIDAKILVSTVNNVFADKNFIGEAAKNYAALIPFKLFMKEKVEEYDNGYGVIMKKVTAKTYSNINLLNGTGVDEWKTEIYYENDGYAPVNTYSFLDFCDWGNTSNITNRWTTCKNIVYKKDYFGDRATPVSQDFYIPLPAGSYGEIVFCLSYGCDRLTKVGFGNGGDVNFILMNDIKLTVVDRKTVKEIELTDVEYNAYVNKQFKSDGDDIELIVGTNKQAFPNENGSLLEYDSAKKKYYFSTTFTKAGETAEAEKLILRSFISNYKSKTSSLSLSLNHISPFGYVTSKYIPTSKLMVVGYKMNALKDKVEVVVSEIFEDNVSINSIEYEPN